nr:glycosyltransferase [Leptolyngbya sp. PCC 6406]
MRILIYSYNYHPEPIGIAPLMTELAEGLVQRGHEVRVITAMPNYPERQIYQGYRGNLYRTEERNGVTIQRCYVWIRPNPGFLARMLLDGSFVLLSFLQALRGWRPDVILSTSPSLPASVPVALLGQIYRCPTILNLQDILPEAAVQTGLLTNHHAIRVFEYLERFAYRSATHISVIAEGFRQNLLSKGVDDAKMSIISNWVDVDFIRPLPKYDNAFRQTHNLGRKFVVLYSGNIARTQGINTVIRAAHQLQAIPDIAFMIAGEESQLDGNSRRAPAPGYSRYCLHDRWRRESTGRSRGSTPVSGGDQCNSASLCTPRRFARNVGRGGCGADYAKAQCRGLQYALQNPGSSCQRSPNHCLGTGPRHSSPRCTRQWWRRCGETGESHSPCHCNSGSLPRFQ